MTHPTCEIAYRFGPLVHHVHTVDGPMTDEALAGVERVLVDIRHRARDSHQPYYWLIRATEQGVEL